MAVYSASNIANFVIFLMSDSCDDLSNMKLNKILYYAQGHYLGQYGQPLFSDDFEAWQHGPVIPAIYHQYKVNGSRCIKTYSIEDIKKLPNHVKSFLLDIAREYGTKKPIELRNMTHSSNSPWDITSAGQVISKSIIQKHFRANEKNVHPLEIKFSDNDFIGKRDENGVLVLPEAWKDAAI